MAKQLNVNLAFKADTGEAKAQLQELQRSLSTLMTSAIKTTNGLGITQDIAEATNEVAKLQAMLEQSKSATGGLDLGKFNQSLKQGGMQISDYAKTLSSLGPAGDQAFAQLAKSVIHAEVPLKRTNTLLNGFKTTLANTARWQISSSILHGFMGSVQQAFGYAQDLNESLNNIRIVTGLNTDQMAAFAKEANAAAQALSTTTTEYTNASLIFFQQGLDEQQVKERTDITIKLAQAAGQSVEQTSDQLTAVWNNFAENGTQSLEHYADAMTKLGAVTASSVDEIAGGLEKFASIGPMIGLSFDNAAAALATITATTRQSEEVVGTALKTIFARIQGLNLGETLDDGTTLNKYSAALQAVGISIKDQNGELKAMDDILTEMGAKWETLNKDQQVALAQTVAGVRQYNQLVSLMDNFDFYEQNLLTAQTSDGALNEAADIYAESWEAARDRVTAAAEEIYNQLLNDEFFIDLNNGFAGFLNILSNTIDGLGGLPGVLLVASSLMMKLFGKDMATAIDNWGYNIKLRSKEGIQDILNMRQKAVESLKTMYADNIDTGPTNSVSARAFEADANLADQLLVKEQELLAKGTALTAEKKQEAQYMIQITEQFGQQAIQSAKLLEKTEQQGNELEQQLKNQIRRHNANVPEGGSKIDYKKDIAPQIQSAKQLQIQYSALESAFNKLKAAQSKGLSTATIIQELERMSTEAENAGLDVTSFKTALANLNSGMDVKAALDSIETDMYQIGDAAFEASDEIRTALSGAGMSGRQVDAILDQLYNSWVQQGVITAEVAEKLKNVSIQAETAGKKIAEMDGPPPTVGQKIVAVGNLLSNVAMSVSAVKGLFDTWNNEDMSFGDKLISTFTTLGMVIPMVASAFSKNNVAMLGSVSTSLLAAAGFDTAGISATIAAGGVGALWAALWPIALVAAVVAAVIAGLVVAINAISDAYNKDALAAERAEESARNLADAYNTAKTEYEEMVSAMEVYQSARSGLDSLTEGTEAYASALKEANRLALELINNYGLVAGQDYDWEGDELVINDEALERVQKTKEAEVDQAYATSQMANVQAKAARNKSNQTDLQRDIRDQLGVGTGDQWIKGALDVAAGLALDVASMGLSGGLGTAAALGSVMNRAGKADSYDAAIDKAIEEYSNNANLFDTKEVMAEELNINDEELIDALWSNKDAIISLGNDMNAAEAAFELAAQNSANEILSNNETVQNSKNADEVTAAGGKIYGNAYNDAYEEYLSKASDRGWFNTGTEDSKQMMKEYAAAAGLDQLKGYEVTNYTGDGTVEYEYIDDDGKRQVKEVTAEEIAATLAAAKAAEDLAGAAERLTEEFNNLDASGKAYDQALKGFLSTGNFETSSRKEALALLEEAGGNNGHVSKTEAAEYMGERFGTGVDAETGESILTDEDARAYGYASAQAMIDAFYEEAQNIETAWESIKLPDNLLGLDDLSLETAQALENAFDKMNIGPLGEKAGQEFTDGLNKMISELDAEEQQQALAALANIDWSSWDALEQADLIMQEFGVDIDTTSQEWVTFAERMRIANGATPDFSGLKDTLIEISGILNDLEFGDIIDDEDYQKLVAYNDEWERFFILQADGTRKFVGDSAEMLAQTRANIEAQREELRIRQETQENFSAAGWGYTDSEGTRITDESKVWKGREGSDTASAENLKNASGATQEMLELLGYTDERIQEMIDQANSADEQLKATGEAALAQMYDAIYNFSQEDLAAMEVDLDEMMASTAANVADLQGLLDAGQISAEAYGKQLNYLIQTQANSAESLAELQSIMEIAQQAGGEVNYELYADNLIRLAEEYDNCTREIEEYQRALANGEDVEAAEEALEISLMLGEAAEKYGFEAKELEVQAKQLAKAYDLDAEAAAKLAIQNQRMNKGIITLAENWEDWSKALKASDKTTLDWAKAAVECTAAIADLVGASEDLELPEEFFNTDNMALLEAAINGDVDAINRLGAAVASEQVKLLQFNDAMASLALETMEANGVQIDVGFDFGEQFEADKQYILDTLDSMKAGSMEAGTAMGDDWVAALNRMALATGMSVEQMNSILGSMGVQAKVETTYVKQPMEVPTYIEHVVPQTPVTVTQGEDADGNPNEVTYTPVKKYSVPGEPMKVEGFAAVAQISTEDNPMTVDVNENVVSSSGPSTSRGSAATYTGNRGSVAPSTTEAVKNAKNSGGGGGDTKPAEKVETTKKEDIVDRYKELDDTLDDVADAYEDASKEADRLYGKARIDKIKQQNAYLQQEIGLLKDKIAAAKTYLAIDKQALDTAAQKAGVSFVYDEAGNLTNYTQQMEALYAELRAAQDAWNADYQNKTQEEQQEYEENILQPIQDKIDELKAAIEAYEETRELIEDLENEIDDKFYEWQDNNYEILHYELEIEIEINDLELEYIDYYLNKITDDFYSMAEAAQYMNNQIPIMTDSLGQYENFYNKITSAYAAGEISQADYVEGMQESYSAILDQLSALNDLDKEMMHYYEETLDAASEELSYYTDQMEHLTSVLEHYRNIVELVNGEFDYESIGTILEGQATTLKNELDAATANYQMLLTEQAAAEEAYRNAQDEAARELYAEELKAITAQVDEAHDLMLSKTEEWAEAQKAIMENTMAQAAHDMEMAFTNGMGFDLLNDSLDRLNSYADEYLTKTNQIYETQTLINTAQKAIDKTTNEAAKVRLKSFTEEIQQLQEKNQLSHLELEIAKAKYDVLLAEIALEEAQNAKATVRLQRDSEGNFGYVYTADQEAISNAEQDLLDAQNNLYNIGLEGANEYGQKILELQQQLADQLVALEEARAAGQFATDAEYYAARDRLISEYTDLFKAYSQQYTTALGVDVAVQQDAWIKAYDAMIKQTGTWQEKVKGYTGQCESAYISWRTVVESESGVIDSVLNDLESEVKDVTDESTNLRNEVVNKIIPALKNQLVSVRNVTSAYASQRSAIQQLISYYEQLAQSILRAIQAQAQLSDSMGTGSAGSSSSFDTSIDYSKRMYDAWQAKDMEAYEQAKRDRDTKIGITGNDYGVSTDRLDDWIQNDGGYDSNGYFTDEWLRQHGFATGGYTGSWGPGGRLAWVHEKELMLNPDDTINFLTATNILRDIVDVIDLNALRNQLSIMPYLPGAYTQGIGDTVEQMVQIEAHFPAVTDRNEIEEAFNNLVNTASQYANRKR